MTLAEKIRSVREKKGMTQKEVATLMGISQQAYGQYESGKREPKPETLIRIAAALGIQVNEFHTKEFRWNPKGGFEPFYREETILKKDSNQVVVERLTEGLDEESLKKLLEYAEFLKSRQEKK